MEASQAQEWTDSCLLRHSRLFLEELLVKMEARGDVELQGLQRLPGCRFPASKEFPASTSVDETKQTCALGHSREHRNSHPKNVHKQCHLRLSSRNNVLSEPANNLYLNSP